jgi:hypothetical protein
MLSFLCRPFNCERIPCLPHTLTRTSKIGAFQMLLDYGRLLQRIPRRWWDFGADAYVVRGWLSLSFPRKPSDLSPPQNSNKHVRLTRNVQSQMVHISFLTFPY